MTPPSGFRSGTSPGAPYGAGYGFGERIGELQGENDALKQQLVDLQSEHHQQINDLIRYQTEHAGGIDGADSKLCGISSDGEFMTRQQFAKRLARAGFLEQQPGAAHEGQHVYHIISASNGGPDHTNNYLYALGGSFNIAVGDRFDHLNCYLAGKAKAEKAVAISLKVARDPSLHRHIDQRGKACVRTFFDGRHQNIKSGSELYKQGEALFRSLRAAARGDMTQCDQSDHQYRM